MKNHLKRIATPRTWHIARKQNVFITRPKPGAHSLEMGLPLSVILRDILHYASTTSEAKKLLHNNDVLIDGKKRTDHRFIVGLFDVISFPALSKHYRVVFDAKGRLQLIEIKEDEASTKISKIIGKTVLKGGKIQYNLYDGKNIVSDQKANVGDSVVLSLPDCKITKVLALSTGNTIYLTSGKHIGGTGSLEELEGEHAVYATKDAKIETARKHLFVVGEKQPLMTLQ